MTRNTSIEAYHKIKDEGLLTEARFSVYDILFERGPMTAGELFQWSQRRHEGHTVVKGSICARLTELRELGVAAEIGKRQCGLTGHTAIVWDVTERLPELLIERGPSKDQQIEALEKENAMLKSRVQALERNLGVGRNAELPLFGGNYPS